MRVHQRAVWLFGAFAFAGAFAQTQIDLRTQGRNADFSRVPVKPFQTGTVLPSTCMVGQVYFKSDAPPGRNFYACTAAGVWTLEGSATASDLGGDVSGPTNSLSVVRLQGRPLSGTPPLDGQLLTWSAASNQWRPLTATLAGDASGSLNRVLVTAMQGRQVSDAQPADGQSLTWNAASGRWEPGTRPPVLAGDASGQAGNTVVTALQGYPVSNSAPASGQVLTWNGNTNQWQPGALSPNYSQAFTAQTTVTIAGSAHGFSSANLLVACYDSSENRVEENGVAIDDQTRDITVTFSTPQTGRCVVNGGGAASASGGSSAVTSIYGRTGAVAARSGDYSFPQIAGTVSNSQLPAGIAAANIGSGSVTSTVFGYLANVQGDIQTQFDNKAALMHSHVVSGDASGDLTGITVTGLQRQHVSPAPALDGQLLTWNGVEAQWEPRNNNSAIAVLQVVLTSPNVLTIGGGCSADAPCNVRFGNSVQSVRSPATVTVTAGTGLALIFVDQTGAIDVGHNLSVACSGCQAVSGITAFPSNVIPIATWAASNGSWNATGSDWRAWLSTAVVNAGQGIVVLNAGGANTLAIDAAAVPSYLTASATLDFSPIAGGACAADLTLSLPGAAPGDSVAAGWPANLEPGMIGSMRVSAPDSIAVRLCNFSGVPVDPAAASFTATIVRSF